MTAQQPLSQVVRTWQDANGGDGLNRIQTRELIRALERQEEALRVLAVANGYRQVGR